MDSTPITPITEVIEKRYNKTKEAVIATKEKVSDPVFQ